MYIGFLTFELLSSYLSLLISPSMCQFKLDSLLDELHGLQTPQRFELILKIETNAIVYLVITNDDFLFFLGVGGGVSRWVMALVALPSITNLKKALIKIFRSLHKSIGCTV